MKVTFIVQLMAALINELTFRGFEIGDTNVTEFDIELLEFSKDSAKYRASIVTDDDAMGEHLHIECNMRKDHWCIRESQIGSVLKERRSGDHVSIVSNGDDRYFVSMTKNYESSFDLEGVDKNALKAIAKDILGAII